MNWSAEWTHKYRPINTIAWSELLHTDTHFDTAKKTYKHFYVRLSIIIPVWW